LSGCGSGDDSPPETKKDVEIFSWWTAGGEKEALDALIAYHQKAHPDENIINAAQQGSATAEQLLETDIAQKRYPDTFQINAGWPLHDWAARTATDGTKLLVSLESLPQAAEWKVSFPAPVLEAVTHENQMYAIPVNVHRNNALFYNKKIFDQNAITPPATLDELFQVAAKLSALPERVIPLAVGYKEAWTLTILVFENLLVAEAGPQYFKDFFSGLKSPDDPIVTQTLNDAVRLFAYTDAGGSALLWDEAVAQVENGVAAMTIMGDWAKGHFESRGQKPDVDFGQVPMPGSQTSFVYNPDCFPLMNGAPNRVGAGDLLATFGSVGGQDVFNPVKGSIPARIDANRTLYDAMSQRTMADFNSSQVQLVLALSGLLSPDQQAALDNAMATFVISKDPAGVIQALKDVYGALGH